MAGVPNPQNRRSRPPTLHARTRAHTGCFVGSVVNGTAAAAIARRELYDSMGDGPRRLNLSRGVLTRIWAGRRLPAGILGARGTMPVIVHFPMAQACGLSCMMMEWVGWCP